MLTTNSLYLPVCAIALSLMVMNAGCLAGDTMADEGDEELGVAQSALCSDVSLVPDATGSLEPAGTYQYMTSVQAAFPAAGYGSTGCGRFVMDISNTKNQPNLLAYAKWGPDGSVPAAFCSQFHVSAIFYGWDGAKWVQIAQKEAVGSWVPFFGSGWCSAGASISLPNNPYTKIRVASFAYRYDQQYIITPESVTVGAEAGYPYY